VINATSPHFLNLMWPIMGQSQGTLYFDNCPNLFDKFLANKNMLKANSPIEVMPDSAEIVHFPEMMSKGDYPQPIIFGGMGKPVNEKGYSDHYPVAVKVKEAD
jgi:hypothetical protein